MGRTRQISETKLDTKNQSIPVYQRSFLPPLPPVVKNLLIFNGLVFLAQMTFRQTSFSMETMFANHHPLSRDFKLFQFITCTFLHGDIGHLAGNMIGLYFFGSKLENLWGARRFINFYLICGLSGSLLVSGVDLISNYREIAQLDAALKQTTLEAYYQLFEKYQLLGYSDASKLLVEWRANPNDLSMAFEAKRIIEIIRFNETSGIMLGASGAIFGLIAATAYLFPNDTVYFNMLIPIKMKWLALIYGFITLKAIANNVSDGVSHFGHLGGGVVGFCLVYFYYQRNRRNFY